MKSLANSSRRVGDATSWCVFKGELVDLAAPTPCAIVRELLAPLVDFEAGKGGVARVPRDDQLLEVAPAKLSHLGVGLKKAQQLRVAGPLRHRQLARFPGRVVTHHELRKLLPLGCCRSLAIQTRLLDRLSWWLCAPSWLRRRGLLPPLLAKRSGETDGEVGLQLPRIMRGVEPAATRPGRYVGLPRRGVGEARRGAGLTPATG